MSAPAPERQALACTGPGCPEHADPTRGTGDRCEGCHDATRDRESPLDLGPGTWVKDRRRGILVWQAGAPA